MKCKEGTAGISKHRIEKAFYAIMIFQFVVLIFFLVAGYVRSDFIGYVSFGLVILSAFCVLQVSLSLVLKKKHRKLAFYMWTGVGILSLAASILVSAIMEDLGGALISEYSMLILSFPLGITSSVIHFYLSSTVNGVSYIGLTWLLFYILGYLQWFVLLPWIADRIVIEKSSRK